MLLPTENLLIKVESLSVRFDKLSVLDDIDFSLYKNDFVAISGPNGGGKTTFLRTILGLQTPSLGKCIYYADGVPVKRMNIGYLPQRNEIDYKFPITVKEVVQSGLIDKKNWFRRLSKQEKEQTDRWIDLLDLHSLLERPIGQLSGGQLQRALLGRALVSSPEVLILDEPSSYLDKKFEANMYDLLKEIAADTTIMVVSHELGRITSLANRIVYVDKTLREEAV